MDMEQANGKATQIKKRFKLEYRIGVRIEATPERIWALLTDADNFARWNSTVAHLEGPIALGKRLAIEVPVAPGRTFHPKVTEFVPGRRMVWSDGAAPMFKGQRTFTLMPLPDGCTEFTMTEVLSGLMLPLAAASLPDFRPVFEQYARDLKTEAERS